MFQLFIFFTYHVYPETMIYNIYLEDHALLESFCGNKNQK